MAQLLMIAGVGMTAAGQIQQGRAIQAQTQSAEAMAAYNVAVQKREAEAVRQKGRFEQARQVKRAARAKSALVAKLGAAGGLGAPVAADLIAEQAAESELERLLIGYEAEIGAERALSQAELDRLSGKLAKRRGKAAVTAGRIGAGATLLSGFA